MLDARVGTRALAAVAATLVVLVLAPASARSSGDAGTGARVDAAAGDSAVVNGEVVIRRDSWGVPHIFAHTVYDLFYGYGYAVAQDRLFQMEMSKRSVNGTVAEVSAPTTSRTTARCAPTGTRIR